MAKVVITIEDDGDGGASVSAIVEKYETEGEATTLAETIGAEIMEYASLAADESYVDGELVQNKNTGGYNGKH